MLDDEANETLHYEIFDDARNFMEKLFIWESYSSYEAYKQHFDNPYYKMLVNKTQGKMKLSEVIEMKELRLPGGGEGV